MKALIVHAHPEPKSFTTALKDAAARKLFACGHEVTVSDLYAMNFDPVAKAADFRARSNSDYLVYALEQRHAFDTGTLRPDIDVEFRKLEAADLLILTFPIYWFSVPAILKGWIDRVLLSGPCYGGKRFYDRGGMAGKRMLAILTTGGREHMFGTDAIHGDMHTMLRPLLRGTFSYVGYDVLPPFIAWHVPNVSDEVRRGYLDQLDDYLGRLDQLAPLPFPRMDQFDDQLFPIGTRAT